MRNVAKLQLTWWRGRTVTHPGDTAVNLNGNVWRYELTKHDVQMFSYEQ